MGRHRFGHRPIWSLHSNYYDQFYGFVTAVCKQCHDIMSQVTFKNLMASYQGGVVLPLGT